MTTSKKIVAVGAVLALSLSACSLNISSNLKTDDGTEQTSAPGTGSSADSATVPASTPATADSNAYITTSSDEASNIQVAATIVPDVEYSVNELHKDLAPMLETLKTQKADIEKSLAALKDLKAPTDASFAAYVTLVNSFITETETYLKLSADVEAALTANDSATAATKGKLLMDQYLKLSDVASKIGEQGTALSISK